MRKLTTNTSLFQKLSHDLTTHGDNPFSPGFQAIAVARLGAARMNIESSVLRKPLSLLYKMAARRVIKDWGIELPCTVSIGDGVRIDHQNGIVIHGNTKIGNECVIRQNVTIGAKNIDGDNKFKAPVIGNNVDIGSGAIIIGDIKIGNNVKIGAGAIVTKDVPNNCTVTGVNSYLTSENRF